MFIHMKMAVYVHVYESCMTQRNYLAAISVCRCVLLIPQLTFNKCKNKVWIILQLIQFSAR